MTPPGSELPTELVSPKVIDPFGEECDYLIALSNQSILEGFELRAHPSDDPMTLVTIGTKRNWRAEKRQRFAQPLHRREQCGDNTDGYRGPCR